MCHDNNKQFDWLDVYLMKGKIWKPHLGPKGEKKGIFSWTNDVAGVKACIDCVFGQKMLMTKNPSCLSCRGLNSDNFHSQVKIMLEIRI